MLKLRGDDQKKVEEKPTENKKQEKKIPGIWGVIDKFSIAILLPILLIALGLIAGGITLLIKTPESKNGMYLITLGAVICVLLVIAWAIITSVIHHKKQKLN